MTRCVLDKTIPRAGAYAALGILLSVCFPLGLFAQVALPSCDFRWIPQITSGSSNSPGVLLYQACAFDSRRQVEVFFGGENPLTHISSTSETWEWDGASWTKRNSGQAPARKGGAMAYDSDRGVCVLFGGGTNVFQGDTPFNDTWEWNGSVWVMRQGNNPNATDRPPPMEKPIMVYDSFRKRTLLLGSSVHIGSDFKPVTRTWEWDGNRWSVVSNAPPARIDSAMCFDPIRGVTVLFGGLSYDSNEYLYDTWLRDGSTWRLVPLTNVHIERSQHAMAFDVHRKVLVMAGGYKGNIEAPFGDSLEWNGTSWSTLTNADFVGFKGRRLLKMWYETGAERVMIFGGTISSQNTDGSYTHTIYDDVYEGRPPGQWVDFNYPGEPSFDEWGLFNKPFNTLAEAVNFAAAGCTINIKTGSRAETITITKPLKLEAYYGPVTIGR